MAQRITSRTIHTIEVDMTDDVLAKIEEGDEVEVVLVTRQGRSSAKKLTYRDTEHMLRDMGPRY
jgi:hypothetical protein